MAWTIGGVNFVNLPAFSSASSSKVQFTDGKESGCSQRFILVSYLTPVLLRSWGSWVQAPCDTHPHVLEQWMYEKHPHSLDQRMYEERSQAGKRNDATLYSPLGMSQMMQYTSEHWHRTQNFQALEHFWFSITICGCPTDKMYANIQNMWETPKTETVCFHDFLIRYPGFLLLSTPEGDAVVNWHPVWHKVCWS